MLMHYFVKYKWSDIFLQLKHQFAVIVNRQQNG